MIIAPLLVIMKIALFYKTENLAIISKIKEEAKNNNIEIDNEKPDVVFSIGGDGTFLRAVHKYIDRLDSLLFVGINNGSLGFFYDFNVEEISLVMRSLAKGDYSSKEHLLLKGVAEYANKKEEFYALNEVRLENPFHTLISAVYINEEKLENYRGNGLIVSSSLGSSAYNKSLGGALIDHSLNALEITEIASIQNNAYRSLGSSLVINGDKKVSFVGPFKDAVVGFDHLNIKNDDSLEKVSVSYSDKKVRIIYSKEHSYVERIKKSFVL